MSPGDVRPVQLDALAGTMVVDLARIAAESLAYY
jgi:hypothetical protein